MKDLTYCALYKHEYQTNLTKIYRYTCQKGEVCCESSNGCCPKTVKYYQSWCFWVFAIGMVLVSYLLCWYCKKLEKERQSERRNAENRINTPGILPSPRATVPNRSSNVDYLLETLIANYRSGLNSDPNSSPSAPSLNAKNGSPPNYVDALKMPKPQENTQQSTARMDHQTHDANSFVVVVINDDEAVPSYEEAVKKL